MGDLDLIWNISLICPWDCEFCCTDAVHVSKDRRGIVLREESLANEIVVNADSSFFWPEELSENGLRPNYLDRALYERQRRGKELLLSEKMAVLNNIGAGSSSIDFAGGDPIACAENILVIQAAAKRFGRHNISITSTGHSISRYPFELISDMIGMFEFTYDEPRNQAAICRPAGYNFSNIEVAKKFSFAGVRTKCQIPMHVGNIGTAAISKIVADLKRAEVSEILLMRVFPVGRGGRFIEASGSISKDNARRAIDQFREESARIGGPEVRLQCALKHLYSESNDNKNPCDMMQRSFGINYQGLLLTSAWATNERGLPLSDDFILGSLIRESFDNISKSERFRAYAKRLDENWGHCKIFAYVNAKNKSQDSIFLKSDPLFNKQ